MGCSIYAHAIVGLRIPWYAVCKGQKKVKAFDHNHPEDWEIDPKTGHQLWYMEDVFIDGWEEYDAYSGASATLYGCEVVYKKRYGSNPDYVFICLVQIQSGNLMEGIHMLQTNMPSARDRKEFKDQMKRIGLWDQGSYGLWLFGYGIA